MYVTLRQLQIFEAVARHSSISRAGAELLLSQPAVSMQIKQLEDQIGLKLFDFVAKRMVLTEAGLELRCHATRFAEQTDELSAAMESLRGLGRGLLRLTAVSTPSYFLPRIIAAFTATYPGVQISLAVVNRNAAFATLADNRTDLAITGQPPKDPLIEAQHFMDNPLVVIAAPKHRLASSRTIELRELAEEIILLREPGSGTRAAVERHFATHKATFRPGGEFSTNEAIKQAVQTGLGLAIVPAQTIELELETRRLAVLPVSGFPVMRQWYVLHRTDRQLTKPAKAFRDLLLEHSPPAWSQSDGAPAGSTASLDCPDMGHPIGLNRRLPHFEGMAGRLA